VGYGDIYPKTFLGRLLTIVLMVFGVAVFSAAIARISSLFVGKENKLLTEKEERQVNKVITEEKIIEKVVEKLSKENEAIEAKLDSIEKKLD
jgi:voltage-gated potassium channel